MIGICFHNHIRKILQKCLLSSKTIGVIWPTASCCLFLILYAWGKRGANPWAPLRWDDLNLLSFGRICLSLRPLRRKGPLPSVVFSLSSVFPSSVVCSPSSVLCYSVVCISVVCPPSSIDLCLNIAYNSITNELQEAPYETDNDYLANGPC